MWPEARARRLSEFARRDRLFVMATCALWFLASEPFGRTRKIISSGRQARCPRPIEHPAPNRQDHVHATRFLLYRLHMSAGPPPPRPGHDISQFSTETVYLPFRSNSSRPFAVPGAASRGALAYASIYTGTLGLR
jgi:hypothetical protein